METARMKKLALVLATSAAIAAAPVAAQWGSGGLFTQDGVEVSVDERVFAVFALLNAIGYDLESEKGPAPVYAPKFSDARNDTRRRFGRPGSAVRAFEGAVAKNAGEASAYARAAVHLGAAPKFSAPKGKGAEVKIAKALSKHVAAWYNEEGGGALYRAVSPTLRDKQKAILEPLDKRGRALVKAARLPEEDDVLEDAAGPQGRVKVVLNPLDAHGTLQRVTVGDTTYIIAGPRTDKKSRAAVVDAASVAFARSLVAGEAAKNAGKGTLGDLHAKLSKSAKAGVGDRAGFVAEALACAMVQRAAKGASCAASPLAGEAVLEPVVAELKKRLEAFAGGDKPLAEGIAALTAAVTLPEPKAAAAPSK
jgi:hypothetical protein